MRKVVFQAKFFKQFFFQNGGHRTKLLPSYDGICKLVFFHQLSDYDETDTSFLKLDLKRLRCQC